MIYDARIENPLVETARLSDLLFKLSIFTKAQGYELLGCGGEVFWPKQKRLLRQRQAMAMELVQ